MSATETETQTQKPADTQPGGTESNEKLVGGGDGTNEGGSEAGATNTDVEGGTEEAAATEELTRGQKIKRHFRKWWWAYLIGNIIFLAIFLPVL